MLDLYELEQLAAFGEYGTLSEAAERLHISQPTLTRSMRHLEDEFGVPLFNRTRNRIELNETGMAAVECARRLLQEAERAVSQVRTVHQRQRTIIVRSCAPAPLWELMKLLEKKYPGMTISSGITQNDEVVRNSWCRQMNSRSGSWCGRPRCPASRRITSVPIRQNSRVG